MSSTRHSSAERRQHGLASDPVYAAAQGIQGTIATKKAGILTSQRARSLVFFLQSLSLPELAGRPNPGGLKRWVREFLKEFSERLGTPSMHKHGMKPGQVYSTAQARAVRSELSQQFPSVDDEFPLIGDTEFNFEMDEVPVQGARASYPAQAFITKCRQLVETRMEQFLVNLCTDPRFVFNAPGEDESATISEDEINQAWPEAGDCSREVASLVCFNDIMGALFEFQQRVAQRQAENFAMTSIASQVFAALDAGQRLRRIVLINGTEGIGKSEATRAWCAQHLGEARYVDLTGITNKTSFFSSIARALGLPWNLKAMELQARVEAMLQRSGMMLVIDESHFVWPQSERSEAPPELVNWIDTALCNRGVAVGLISTPQFFTSMRRVQKKTCWNSGQFQRRIKRVAALPERPTLEDLEAVARKLLPKASASVIKLLVGFAGSQQCHHLDALSDAVKEAAEIARVDGRDAVAFADVDCALKGVLSQTALAKTRIFAHSQGPSKRGRATTTVTIADVLKDPRNGVSGPLQHEDLAEKSARTVTPVSTARARENLAHV